MPTGWIRDTPSRKSRLPDNWQELRKAVIARSGGRCELLKKDGRRCWDKGVDVDHIIPNDDDSMANLQHVCAWHHARKTGREGREARSVSEEPWRKLLRREPEKHPGSIDPKEAKPLPRKGF